MGINGRGGRGEACIGRVILLVVGFSLLLSSGASGALYIKFDGIEGEATQQGHEKWSEVSSVQWGVIYTGGGAVGGGASSGRAVFDDLAWNQVMDKSFPKLFNAISTGKSIRNATVEFTASWADREFTYFKMEFKNALLTELLLSGTSGQKATFEGSFAYDYIKMTYTEYGPDGHSGGTTSADYDLKKLKGSIGALGEVYALGLEGPVMSGAPVPVPPALWLLGSGLACLAGLRRRIGR